MHVESILRRLAPIKGFTYQSVNWTGNPQDALTVELAARKGSRPVCSGCGQKRRGYDRLSERRWRHVPFWGIAVYLAYGLRRVDCPRCGVKVELVPWGDGKTPLTAHFQWFLSRWARRLSWQEVARSFGTSWDSVYRSVRMAVEWGLVRRDLSGVTAIGVDEVAWQKGHHYLTVVYEITGNVKRLLWVAEGRTIRSLLGFFRLLGKKGSAKIAFVASDMWQAYLSVIARKAPDAVHVLDRYHVVAKMNRAIDQVRADEAKRLAADGHEQVLKHSRWCLLKRPWNRTKKEIARMRDLLKYNLRTMKAYLLKEEFQRFWEYKSLEYAGLFLAQWCAKVKRTGIEPMIKVAESIDEHGELIMNYIAAKGAISSGVVEGLNNKLKLHTKRAYGFRTYDAIQTALYHGLGHLPEPTHTHRFC